MTYIHIYYKTKKNNCKVYFFSRFNHVTLILEMSMSRIIVIHDMLDKLF